MARRITRWIFENLLWDTTGGVREGFLGGLWAARKLLVAVVGTVLLTWLEWVEHHPPEIAVVALIHFVFMLVVIAVVVCVGGWFGRGGKRPT